MFDLKPQHIPKAFILIPNLSSSSIFYFHLYLIGLIVVWLVIPNACILHTYMIGLKNNWNRGNQSSLGSLTKMSFLVAFFTQDLLWRSSTLSTVLAGGSLFMEFFKNEIWKFKNTVTLPSFPLRLKKKYAILG